MARLARWIGVAAGIATGCGFWLTFILGGHGKESSWCERNCEDPVYAPQWVDNLFLSGIVYFLLIMAFAAWMEKKKQDPHRATLLGQTEEAAASVLLGAVIGGIGTPLLMAIGTVLLIMYGIVTQ